MATLRNLSASALSVPALDGRTVEPGESAELDNATAAGFLDQPDWQVELDDDDPRSVPELKAELEKRGQPTTGRKSELIARLAAAPPAEPEAGSAEQSTTEQGE